MFVDARSMPNGTEIEADVCVVGSGAAGLSLAHEFLDQSTKVCLIESGELEADDKTQDLYDGQIVGHPYHALDIARTRQFGGSTNCWGAYCRIFDQLDFEVRETIPHSGWPFGLQDLLPYYERAHKIANLGPVDYSFDFWNEQAKELSNPFDSPLIERAIIQLAYLKPDIVSDRVKSSQNLTAYLNANATEIETDEAGREVVRLHVKCLNDVGHSVKAKHYIIAAGGIENPRLLLLSNRHQKNGLGNDNDLVGRFFMDHYGVKPARFAPRDPLFRARNFPPATAAGDHRIRNALRIAESVRAEEGLLRSFFDLAPRLPQGESGYKSAKHVIRMLIRRKKLRNLGSHIANVFDDRDVLMGIALKKLGWDPKMRDRPGKPFYISVAVEPTPNPDSRVTLADETDRLGQRKSKLDWRIDPRDNFHVRRSVEILKTEAERLNLGAFTIVPEEKWFPIGHYHHIGTTRMDNDPNKGVVDANGRVHGVSNLFMAGSSVFPTAGSGTVTLMIVVLATRLADHVKGLMR